MNKRHYNSEETRQVIAEKATQLFAQKGFAGTSIADISRESGFSKGHIYYHFENKEKLFVHLSLETMRHWGEKWQAIAGSYNTSVEKLYGMAHFVMNNYKSPLLPVGQELAMNPSTSPDTLQALQGLAVTPMAAYAAIFHEGVARGEFDIDNVEETTLLFGTWMGTLCQFTLTMEGEPLQRLFQQAVTIFVGGIRKR
ncbi:TetR family transcriptional regulator [Paenibacillus sp. J23TS9]|uniref:TetR/AcrR family transcriptional regulator n=1 Tax=Paenibacillus sp. J23TS9 TaxID=2807193 RepID=UPI001B131B81|nr:TetR/AcrR family transcriptional regulator [Paenibacillus sp. J23TS9]GIP28406.1 TetR family transcriptional regulator [Paenibacillus sp. J23TS9]